MCQDSKSHACENKGNDIALVNTVQQTCLKHCVFHGAIQAYFVICSDACLPIPPHSKTMHQLTLEKKRGVPSKLIICFCRFKLAGNTETLLTRSFKGDLIMNKDMWLELCEALPTIPKVDVIVHMGTIFDYYKPLSDLKLCDMLASNQQHQWSRDGINWITPKYASKAHFGGSAKYYPEQALKGDVRVRLSTWGSTKHAGGCCATSIDESKTKWGQPFKMYLRSGA